jgi:hypothetical protein
MGMTILSVRPSVRPSSVFCWRSKFRTGHNFAFLFSVIDSLGYIAGQVRYRTKSDDPFRSTVIGHSNFKYEAPSCEVSLERSCQELSNDEQNMHPVNVCKRSQTNFTELNVNKTSIKR